MVTPAADSGPQGWPDKSVLFDQHRERLIASAISPEVARERGYVSVDTKAQLARCGFKPYQQRVPGLLIPLRGADGQVWGYQYRPDTPRTRDGKPVKYETPAGQRNRIDVPLRCRHDAGDPTIPMWVTEGSLKADAAASAGLCCVALLGVWGWRGINTAGGRTVVADWGDFALNGRLVPVAFDSDATAKHQVRGALDAFAAWLGTRGAEAAYAHLPAGADGAKTGLDDYLAAHGVDGIYGLVRGEPPPLAAAVPVTPRAHTAHLHTPPAVGR
jgi:Domain of unknown function (DUF3854)